MESAFVILYSKWRIISNAIETEVELADKTVKCICILHNTIIEKEGFERHLTDVMVQSKSVAWERGRLPTEAKNVKRFFFSVYGKISFMIQLTNKSISVGLIELNTI